MTSGHAWTSLSRSVLACKGKTIVLAGRSLGRSREGACKSLLYDAGNPTLGLCDNLEGWVGWGGRFKRERTYVYLC